jgi:hypothetical protein
MLTSLLYKECSRNIHGENIEAMNNVDCNI